MGVLVIKNQGNIILTRIARLAVVGFLTAFAASFIDTIWAVYMEGFLGNMALVGFFSAFLTVIAFFGFFFFVPFIEKKNKSNLFSLSLALYAIIYLIIAINKNPYIFVALAIVSTILTTLKITSFGIIIRDKSRETELARNEGVMYTLMNTAWVIGPLIAGLLSEFLGISFTFIISAIFMILALVSFKVSRIQDPNIKKRIDRNMYKNFKEFFKNKNRVLSYIIGGGVPFWWALIYLFIPMFIIGKGLPIEWVGYFLFAIAVPLILFTYLFAKLAGKVGFKKLFKIGFFILFISVLSCFFISGVPTVLGFNSVYAILGILVLASTGMAMLESTVEAYFFDLMKEKEELHFYGPYNTNLEVSRLIAYAVPSVILIFLDFKFIFLFFALVMLFMFFLSFRVREVIEKRHHNHNKN